MNHVQEQAQVRRVTFEQEWNAADREWAERRDKCQCEKPVPGPRCLGTQQCRRCGFTVQSQRR